MDEQWSLTRTLEFATRIVYQPRALTSDVWDEILDPAARPSPHILLTDTTVARHYLEPVLKAIEATGRRVLPLVVPPGERSKSLRTYSDLCKKILGNGIDRHTTLIAMGGGVINNLGGFIASTLYRGITLIQAPTTLLAQLDAVIDFRQAVNGPHGKNQIGSYYPAAAIVADPEVLRTLDERQIRNGLAEAAKHALTQDPGLYDLLARGSGLPPIEDLIEISKRTIELKLETMRLADGHAADLVLQYGHAWGHALEHVSKYGIQHGEGIAIGMCVMAEMAASLDLCKPDLVGRHVDLFARLGLPTTSDWEFEALVPTLTHDKFHDHRGLSAILLADVGVLAWGVNGATWLVTREMMEVAYRQHQLRAWNGQR